MFISEVAPILLGRVSERIGVGKGNKDAPVKKGGIVSPEREDAPDEEEAEHEREADEVREIAREIAGVDDAIQFEVAAAEIPKVLDLAILSRCGKFLQLVQGSC